LGLTWIKTPVKLAVVQKGKQTVRLNVANGGARGEHVYYGVESEDFDIYASQITETRTHATLQEMAQLLNFVAVSGYSDINRSNFIFAGDGIYVIDTEFANFDDHPHIEQFGRMVPMCEEITRENFRCLVLARSKLIEAELTQKLKVDHKERKHLLKINGFMRHGKPMKLQVNSFMGQAPAPASSSSVSQPQIPESSSSVPPLTQLREVFAKINELPSITSKEMMALIAQLPNRTRRQIYKIAANWGNQPGDVRWGKAHCAQHRKALLGILIETQLYLHADLEKRGVLSQSDFEQLRQQLQELSVSYPKQPL
jgi:hypothetical protein